MKIILKIIAGIFLSTYISVSGQSTVFDSLMKKARLEIYDNPDDAISTGKQLLRKEKDIHKQISIYQLLSTANIAKRDFDQSLHYLIKAKETAQKTNDQKVRTSVLISAAIQYQQMELFSKSLETLNEADQYMDKLPDNLPEKYIETARSYAIRGMIYKSQANPEIALEKFLISIRNFEKVKNKQATYSNMSVVYYNIGYCYLNLGQLEKAHQALIQSAAYAQKNGAKSLEAFALKGMAEMYKQKKENEKALQLLIKAEDLSKNTRDLILNEGIYKEMSENYLAMEKPDLYQNYSKKYFEMRFQREQNELNSINHSINDHNRETLKKSSEMKTRYQYITGFIVSLGILCIAVLLYLIIKVRKQNLMYRRKIQELIRF
ncbi:lipopolysaccharide assembly protein LapB [Chryseobacterium sp. W4I1]|uniref:tetratricopeptide repeat protein n=1 Tax=Chryseobacterium sp. W4I1 TaxID=3042293 RepID=UPI0027882312|nr:tetratricopeptide repeat protein [Chryseobacterium sp. W4I1]MDQ0782756.1 tetratricopeptide (TPR) repeat protein [Chryseobacterium sp. W4I1]